MRKLFMLLVLLAPGVFFTAGKTVHAQQQTVPQAQQQTPEQTPQEPSAQEPETEPEEDLQAAEFEVPAGTAEDNDLILADIDADADQDDALRNGRFIPTEEISQDLGVSFPVDI